MVEKEYQEFIDGIDKSLNPLNGTALDRSRNSVEFARKQRVAEKRIFKNPDELRYWLGEGWK